MDGAKKKPASALFYKRKRMSDQSDRVKKRLSKQRQAGRDMTDHARQLAMIASRAAAPAAAAMEEEAAPALMGFGRQKRRPARRRPHKDTAADKLYYATQLMTPEVRERWRCPLPPSCTPCPSQRHDCLACPPVHHAPTTADPLPPHYPPCSAPLMPAHAYWHAY